MLRWSIYALMNMLFMLVCYVTNPIVCLLCDEEGELLPMRTMIANRIAFSV